MIETWLFTALVMGVLALCVILRSLRSASQEDRFVAGTVAVILVSAAALTLSIAWAAPVITDAAIFLDICYMGIAIWKAKNTGAEES